MSDEIRYHGIQASIEIARARGQIKIVVQRPPAALIQRLEDSDIAWRPTGDRNGRPRIEIDIAPLEPVVEIFPDVPIIP